MALIAIAFPGFPEVLIPAGMAFIWAGILWMCIRLNRSSSSTNWF